MKFRLFSSMDFQIPKVGGGASGPCRFLPVNAFQCLTQVLQNRLKGLRKRAMAGDHNIIISRPDMGACDQPDRFFQSAPRAIARNRGSEPLGGGKPESRHYMKRLGVARRGRWSETGLKHEAPGAPHAAISNTKEFSTLPYSAHRDEMLASRHGISRAARSKPRGSCGLLHVAVQGLSCHSWSRCAT